MTKSYRKCSVAVKGVSVNNANDVGNFLHQFGVAVDHFSRSRGQ